MPGIVGRAGDGGAHGLAYQLEAAERIPPAGDIGMRSRTAPRIAARGLGTLSRSKRCGSGTHRKGLLDLRESDPRACGALSVLRLAAGRSDWHRTSGKRRDPEREPETWATHRGGRHSPPGHENRGVPRTRGSAGARDPRLGLFRDGRTDSRSRPQSPARAPAAQAGTPFRPGRGVLGCERDRPGATGQVSRIEGRTALRQPESRHHARRDRGRIGSD